MRLLLHRSHLLVWVVGLTLVLLPLIAIAYNWPQFNGNPQHTGSNIQETTITKDNVSQLQRLFQVALPDVADGAPAYQHAVNTLTGVKDLLFLTTTDGRILARDAATGAAVWEHQPPAQPSPGNTGRCISSNGGPCYTTSSPAIDPTGQYVYSYGLDGKVHKYQVGDGVEITGNGWPEVATLKSYNEKGSSALSIATARDGISYLYVANGGYPGDQGDYQGHLTAINLTTGAQHVFNTLCSNQTVHFRDPSVQPGAPDCSEQQSALWARAGVVYDADTDKIYMATGNGTFDPTQHHWGDTVFALHPDGTGQNGDPLDSYTPTTQQQLNNSDADLGSTAPAILPVPPQSQIKHLGVQGGKDQKLRLLNLDDLSSQGGPGKTGGEIGPLISVPQGGGVLTAPAVWVNPGDQSTWVYVTTSAGIAGLQLTVDGSGTPQLSPKWKMTSGGRAQSSPLVANGVVYYAGNNEVRAFDPITGTQLWHNTQIGSIHWESPVVANGVLYLTDGNGNLNAYALNGVLPPTNTPTPSIVPGRGGKYTITLPIMNR